MSQDFRSSPIDSLLLIAFQPIRNIRFKPFQKNFQGVSRNPSRLSFLHKRFCVQKIRIHKAGIEHPYEHTHGKIRVMGFFYVKRNGCQFGNLDLVPVSLIILQLSFSPPTQAGRTGIIRRCSIIGKSGMVPGNAIPHKSIHTAFFKAHLHSGAGMIHPPVAVLRYFFLECC